MDFYEKILLYKAKNKMSYKALGEPISLKPDAMRMALDRQSLTDLQKKEMAKIFGLDYPKKDTVGEIQLNYNRSKDTLPPLEMYKDIDIIMYINKNKERFRKIRSFKMLNESLTLDSYMEDVKNEVENFIRQYSKTRQDQ